MQSEPGGSERVHKIELTAFDLAQRFVGMKEVSVKMSNPAVLSMLQLDSRWATDDSVPWCSAFTNYIAWLLRLPRSKSLRARSWLGVGRSINLIDAQVGFDVVILNRGGVPDPGVLDSPGHVAFYAGHQQMLGGNQGDAVSVISFNPKDLLGVRRLYE
jgi:uncharacterized protein (TIGR02594 family)